jgi:hypothetical protein
MFKNCGTYFLAMFPTWWESAPIGAKAELKLLHESAILVAPPAMRLHELVARLGRNFIGFNVLGVERPIVVDDVGTGPRVLPLTG